MDLTILTTFSQICQSEIRSADLTISTNFSQIRRGEINLGELTILPNGNWQKW